MTPWMRRVQELLDGVTHSEFKRPFSGEVVSPERCQDLTGLNPEPGLVAIVIHDGGDLSAYHHDYALRRQFLDALLTEGLSYKNLDTTDGVNVYSGVYQFCVRCSGRGTHKTSCTPYKAGHVALNEPCLIPEGGFANQDPKYGCRVTLASVGPA